MRNRTLPLVLTAALLLLAGALAAACSDDSAGEPEPTPTRSETPIPQAIDEYLQDIEEIFANTTGEIDKIEATFENDFATAINKEGADDTLRDAIRDYQRVIDGAFRDLGQLHPGVEATAQHDALTAALDRAVTSMAALDEAYQATQGGGDEGDVSTDQTALAARTAEAFALISTELEDACLELQDLAAEQAVEIDLTCGVEAPAPTGSPAPASPSA